MINIEQIGPKAHRITLMAEFRQEDAQAIVDFAKECSAAGGGGNVLFDATAVAGFTFGAVVIELAHIPALTRWIYDLDRIAIISDEEWIRTASRLESALLPGLEYEVYDDDEADAARAWVMEESGGPHTGAIRDLDIGQPGVAAYELSGRLDREESERGVAMVRARLEDPECTRLLLVIRNWHGFDLDRLLSSEVLSGKLEIARKVERYAIVGGPSWLRSYAEFTANFLKSEIRGFDLDEQDKAVAWLNEQSDASAAP